MKILHFKTYLEAIKKAPGTKMFQNVYAEKNDQVIDILKNGDTSCAYFVSSILYLFKCIQEVHATVNGVEKELQNSKWKKVPLKSIKEGDVIVWEIAPDSKGAQYRHIGFYTGNNEAISNSDKTRTPIEHHFTYENKRKIEDVYRFTDWK